LLATVRMAHMSRNRQALRDNAATTQQLSTDSGEPSRLDRIARRAYELYRGRGGENGRELQDWLEAERQIDGSDDDTGHATR
jgi:hypothetical protein